MRLKHRDIIKDGSGSITLIPEEPDDMWHAYNLIAEGDLVRASTVRRVQQETNTGSSSSERVVVTLTIQVRDTEYDSQGGVLRVGGKNVSENKFVKMGAFHTLDLELNRQFTITKSYWDKISLDRIEMATDPTHYADVAALVMAEGLAYLCLITSTTTIVRAKLEVNIPKKRKGSSSSHEKGLERYFEQILQAILRHINFDVVKCFLIGSPGFVKDQFFEYMMLEAQRKDYKVLLENKPKFMLVHTSSGHKHAIKDLFADPQVSAKLENTKAMGEVKALNDFYEMLKNEPDRAFYGIKHVELANERLAIQTLLVTDELFRSADVKTRKRFVKLVESVQESGGEVKVFSSMHVSGEQLAQLTGIAAILRFPLPDIDVDDEEETETNGEHQGNGVH